MLKRVEKNQRLDLIADKVAESALAGDMVAAKEIGDRLDGKATQQIQATITDQRMVAELPPTSKDTAEWAGQHGPH